MSIIMDDDALLCDGHPSGAIALILRYALKDTLTREGGVSSLTNAVNKRLSEVKKPDRASVVFTEEEMKMILDLCADGARVIVPHCRLA